MSKGRCRAMNFNKNKYFTEVTVQIPLLTTCTTENLIGLYGNFWVIQKPVTLTEWLCVHPVLVIKFSCIHVMTKCCYKKVTFTSATKPIITGMSWTRRPPLSLAYNIMILTEGNSVHKVGIKGLIAG